jgi:hypothetical protein
MVSPQIVYTAIYAGLRLYRAGYTAYVDSTRNRALTLPLPRAPQNLTVPAAIKFFRKDDEQIKAFIADEKNERLRGMLKKLNEGENLPQELAPEFLQLYTIAFWSTQSVGSDAKLDPSGVNADELISLLTIRQWSETEAPGKVTALQQIAGTLVNVAVDYFAHTPGLISSNRPEGRALMAFLETIDDVDFAATPLTDLAGSLLVGVLDGVNSVPEIISGGAREQELVRDITRALAVSANQHLATASEDEKRSAGSWLQLIAHSIVKSGAETILADPVRFLSVQPGAEVNVVQQVGGTLTDLVIGKDELQFRSLVSGESLNKITRSVLSAVAENPDVLKIGNDGFKSLIQELAKDLSQRENLFSDDLLPDILRLVLEKSAQNLDLIWPAGSQSPRDHLLVTATSELLKALSESVSADQGLPKLSKAQVLSIAETVLDEVVDNPAWLLERVNGQSTLGTGLKAVLTSLGNQETDRLNAETLVAALRSGLLAAATRHSLLKKIDGPGADAGKVALEAAIDAIIDTVNGETVPANTKWRLMRNSSLQFLIETGLASLAENGAEQKHIDALRAEITLLIQISYGLEEYRKRLDARLKAA